MDSQIKEEGTYILSVGQSASNRLDMQHKIFSADSDEHLKRAGLSEGQTVWDIGCGNGVMTVNLAKRVGNRGHVYALDMSEDQLAIAKEKVISEGLTNVTFVHGDIRTLKSLPTGEADLVYIRLVLMHLKDPEIAISSIKDLLKEGGVVVSNESIMSESYCSSSHEVFGDYLDTLMSLGMKLGVDYDIGHRLQDLYDQAGYMNTTVSYTQSQINLEITKKGLLGGLAEWKDKAIAHGLTTEDKANYWDQIIRNWPDDDSTFFYAPAKQAYVLAWKEKE